MRILYYCDNNGSLMHMWQQYHFYHELNRHDVEIVQFNPLEYPDSVSANLELLNEIFNNEYHLFMTPHNEEKLFIRTLLEIKRAKIPSLLICYDNLVIPHSHKNICSEFDLVWLTAPENRDLFEKWGANIIFQPYAANPYNFTYENFEDNGKVCFIGTPYGSRINILNALTSKSINVDLYSSVNENTATPSFAYNKTRYIKPFFDLVKFKHGRKIILGALKQAVFKEGLHRENLVFKSPVPFGELSNLYSNYAVSLSSTTSRNTGVLAKPLSVVNLRSFEIAMSGGLQLCYYNEELANYFEDGREIVFYKNKDDFVDKCKFYMSEENRSKRLEIKKNARLRAELEHTWWIRFSAIFERLEIRAGKGH